jgi:hypothetical protein
MKWEWQPRARVFAEGALATRKKTGKQTEYIIAKGVVKLIRKYRSSAQFAYLLGPWDVFGPLVLAKRPLQWPHTEACTDCEIIKVPKIILETGPLETTGDRS